MEDLFLRLIVPLWSKVAIPYLRRPSPMKWPCSLSVMCSGPCVITLFILGPNDTSLLSSATTHADIFLRAKQRGITVRALHNAGIMTGVGACGLELYKFGYTITIPYFTGASSLPAY